MRLLLVGNFLSASRGTRFYCEDLADRLTGRGKKVIKTSCKDGRLVRLADMLYTIARERSRYDCAVVDVYSGPSFFWAEMAGLLLSRLGKPFVAVLHGGGLPEFRQSHQRRFKRLLLGAQLVTTPSLYLKQRFADLREDIVYLPNALDLKKYPWRERLAAQPKLIWLRAFLKSYQPELAIEVLDLLKRDFPEISLEMIGPDKGDGSLGASVAKRDQLGLGEKVAFWGAIPKQEVPERLQGCDIYLNTTRFESFGVAVLEAAACGLPIVSAKVGEMPHLWKDGEEVLLVPPADAESMANAVRRILTEPGLSAQLSRNARKKAEQFDWPSILPQWEALFDELLRSRCYGRA